MCIYWRRQVRLLTFSDRPPHPQSLPAGFLPRPQASFAAWFAPRASICIWLVEAALAAFLQLPLLIGRAFFFFCPSFRAGSGLWWGRPCGAVGSTAPPRDPHMWAAALLRVHFKGGCSTGIPFFISLSSLSCSNHF